MQRPIRFMTFNLRFDTVLDAPGRNRWADRVESVIETLDRERPDVVGFQEALRTQFSDLTANLTRHHGLGRPRDLGDTAEYVPLFFRLGRLELQEHGDFWLSPTPDVEGSLGWDADVPRHCTWARLKDTESEAVFSVLNTHLDVKGQTARFEASKLIVEKIARAPRLAAVVMGDFNATEDSAPLETFRAAGLRDTLRVLNPDATDVQTIHHYQDLTGNRKIDYIMCDARWDVMSAAIVRDAAAGRLPSDHFPVVADLVSRPQD